MKHRRDGAIQLAGFGSLYVQEQVSAPAPNVIAVEDHPSTSAIPVEDTSPIPVEGHPGTSTSPVEDHLGTSAILVEDHPGTSVDLVEDSSNTSDSSRGPLVAKLTELITRLRVSFLVIKYIR